ncbi:MAG UNVERIFIED_CONTAM: hypothetical protein LVR18_09125 [Planctomycetaceae bacterium]
MAEAIGRHHLSERPWQSACTHSAVAICFSGHVFAFAFPMLLTGLLSVNSVAADSPEIAKTAVRILQSRCQSCHGPRQQEGELRVDSREALLTGGGRGPAITSTDQATKSLLLKSVTSGDPDLQMPPKQPLTQSEITVLTQWLEAGAPWPDTSAADAALPPDTGNCAGRSPQPHSPAVRWRTSPALVAAATTAHRTPGYPPASHRPDPHCGTCQTRAADVSAG